MIYPNSPQIIYYVYILLCQDKSYYIGVTNELLRRFEYHQAGLFPSCYTFKRRPVKLVYYETIPFLQEAVEREKQLKKWSRAKKEALIKQDYHKLSLLAQCNNMSHHKYEDYNKGSAT